MPLNLIKIENSFFDAAICLDGDLPDKSIFQKLKETKLVAADGAANKIISKGINPDLIIGDLDSLNKEHLNNEELNLVKIESQESNDFEKALNWCIDQNLHDVLIIGFNGGDLEHSLNNWSVFKKFTKEMKLTILDKDRYAFMIDRDCKVQLEKNEIVSLIPQTKVRLTTEGLNWNLNNEELELGVREGARNIAKEEVITLKILEGELLFFCNSRFPLSFNIKNY